MSAMTDVWPSHVFDVLYKGREVSPRGKRTLELPMYTVQVDMRRPVLLVPERKLSYQFMAAEAHWILSGSNRVDGLAPWSKGDSVSRFSDDGETFFGAYGPKVLGQLDHVVAKLVEDADSRQAVLTIWRENPPPTKDVPCTVAMAFSIRAPSPTYVGAPRRLLEASVFMRSNDVWLGTPYDVFSFSMVGHLVCARLNAALRPDDLVTPGPLRLCAASSHLYEENWAAAKQLAAQGRRDRRLEPRTPEDMFTSSTVLRTMLSAVRDTKPGDPLRWWESKP